ncbi:MAG: hypothetical protein ACRC20_16220 [Segniliparus sp.]|uniref:hypothetical protein n=1 Tax=Segniliparus sp. TaxID=2804064 RepID=UPI003F33BEE1
MEQFRWAVGKLTLPMNVALLLWAASSGWSALVFLMLPLTCLLPSTLMAMARFRRKGELATGMAWAQLATWLGLFVFGLFAAEGAGDGYWSYRAATRSRWTDLAGLGADGVEPSESVARLALAVALIAWLALFALLVLDLRRHLVTTRLPEERHVPSGPASRRRDLGDRGRASKRRGTSAPR